MTMGETITEPTTMVEENLDVPIVSFAESIISKTIADSNIAPERMTRQEKMEIVWELANQGIPRMKGARTFRIHCVSLHQFKRKLITLFKMLLLI